MTRIGAPNELASLPERACQPRPDDASDGPSPASGFRTQPHNRFCVFQWAARSEPSTLSPVGARAQLRFLPSRVRGHETR
jgi:hypothetical protein